MKKEEQELTHEESQDVDAGTYSVQLQPVLVPSYQVGGSTGGASDGGTSGELSEQDASSTTQGNRRRNLKAVDL